MKKKISLALVLTMFLTLIFNSLTFAASPTKKQEEKESIKKQVELYKAIKEIEKNNLTRRSDGTFEITGKPKVRQEILDNLKASVAATNSLVIEGTLSTDANNRVYMKKDIEKGNLESNKNNYVEEDIFFQDAIKKSQEVSLEVGGNTYSLSIGNIAHADSYSPPVGLYYYWWGYQLALDEWGTQVLVQSLSWGSGAAAVAAAMQASGIITAPSVPLSALAFAIGKMAAESIKFADYLGGNKGVYFSGLYSYGLFFMYWIPPYMGTRW